MFVDLLPMLLSPGINEKSTWNEIHNLLINYFSNSAPSDPKEIYQFDISGKVSKEDSVNQVDRKGKWELKEVNRTIKGQGFISESESQQEKGSKSLQKERQSQKGKVNGPHGQGLDHWSWNQGQGGKGEKEKGHQVCSHCGRTDHSVSQCWWAPKSSSAGSSSDHQRQVYNTAAQSADHSVAIMPPDQLRELQEVRPLHQQQPHNQPYYSEPSSSSAASSMFASGQGQGFSGHQLRINHFTSGVSQEHVMEVNFSNHIYDFRSVTASGTSRTLGSTH